MAMSVTATEQTQPLVKLVKFAWVSAADGTATGTTTYAYTGRVLALATDPSATAPTDNYDITVTDSNSLDVLAGAGANRDTANTEYVTDEALLGVVSSSKLTLNVSNAGDSKEGTVYLFIR